MSSKIKGMHALSAAALLAAVATVPAQAATVTFEYTQSFGAVSPDGPAPWATAVFDDGGSPGSVTLTMTASVDIGIAAITGMYFNFVDDTQDTLDGLSFDYSSGPEAISVDATTDDHRADGDGFYDILFDFPPPGSTNFHAGDISVYDITDIAGTLVAADFNVFGSPGPGAGNPGPFLSVARFQSTGSDGNGSDWVGAVPVPAAVWLFGSGLLGLVGVARKRRS